MSSRAKQNINVIVRCRPLNHLETERNSFNVVDIGKDKKTLSVKEKSGCLSSSTSKTFTFDRVFGPNTKQIDVYRSAIQPAVDEVLLGYNCTIFAYGQTGSGKTYTMEGGRSVGDISWEADPLAGVVPRSIAHLFKVLEGGDCEFSVRVSYLELYNEQLFDLLGSSEEADKLRIYDDPSKKGSVVIQGLEEVVVKSKVEIHAILEKGRIRRQTAATLLNATSSRSHSVFMVTVRMKENSVDGEELVKTGKLNLVDLAGSENIGRSGAIDKRAREAGNINQSLLTLGRVITALVDHAPHVPYRESKLTRILRDSLGGRTKTSIIATISPASLNLEETLSTLDYAHRAKNITNKPEINQKLTKKDLIKEYNGEIDKLRKDLQASRDKNGVYIAEENYILMNNQIQSQADLILNQHDKLSSISDELMKIQELYDESEVVLGATQRHLTVTEESLGNAARKLTAVRASRRIVRKDRDEKDMLLGEHIKTEADLGQQAAQLLATAGDTTKDIEGYHAKIERKDAVETHNLQVSGAVHEEMERVTQDGLGHAAQYCSNARNQEKSFIDLLDSNMATQARQVEKLLEWVSALKTETTNQVTDMSQLGETVCNTAEETSKAVHAMANQFETESEMELASWKPSVTAYLSSLKADIEEGRALIESHFQTQSKLIEEQKHGAESVNSDLCSKSEDQRAAVQAFIEQEDQSDMEKLRQLDTMMEMAGHLREQISSSKAARIETHKHFNQLDSSVAQSHSSLQKLHAGAYSGLVQTMTSTKEKQSEITARALTTTQELEAGHSAYFISEEKSRQALLGSARSRLIDLEEDLPLKRHKFTDMGKTANDRLSSNASQLSEGVHTLQETAEQSQEEARKTVVQSTRQGVSAVESLMDMAKSNMDRVTSFVQHELKRDIPTGETPARRTYEFPRQLARTQPHDELVSAYREGYMDESMEESFVMPPPASVVLAVLAKHEDPIPSVDNSSIGSSSDERMSVSCESVVESVAIEAPPPPPRIMQSTPLKAKSTPGARKGSTAKLAHLRSKLKKPLGSVNK